MNGFYRLKNNWIAIIGTLLLCLLPAFIVGGSFSAEVKEDVARIKVVNQDRGIIKSEQTVNYGEKLFAALKKKEGVSYISEGATYEMCLVIPSDFSKCVTSSGDQISLSYFMGPSVATTTFSVVREQVNDAVAAMMESNPIVKPDVGLSSLSSIYEGLTQIYKDLETLESLTNNTKKDLKTLSSLLPKMSEDLLSAGNELQEFITMTQNVGEFMQILKKESGQISQGVERDLLLLSSMTQEIKDQVPALLESVRTSAGHKSAQVDNLNSKVSALLSLTKGVSDFITSLNELTKTELYTPLIKELSSYEAHCKKASKELTSHPDENLTETVAQMSDSLSQAVGFYDRETKAKVSGALAVIFPSVSGAKQMLLSIRDRLPEVSRLMELTKEEAALLNKHVDTTSLYLTQLKEELYDITSHLNGIMNEEEFLTMLKLWEQEIKDQTLLTKEPVSFIRDSKQEEALEKNNVLKSRIPYSLWAGVLFLVLTFSVKSMTRGNDRRFYVSTLFFFIILSAVQAIFVAIDVLLFYRNFLESPWLSLLSWIGESTMYAIIIVTVIYLFGNAGKVLALLVLLTKLPVQINLLSLFLFGALLFLGGLFLKRPLRHTTKKLRSRLKEGGFLAH